MASCPIVDPEVVKLEIADVYRREVADLEAKEEELEAKPQDNQKAKDELTVVQEQLAFARALLEKAVVDADWIEVRAELNAGEERAVYTQTFNKMKFGEETTLDPMQIGKTKILGYLTAWSFVERDGSSLEISGDTLDSMSGRAYRVITAAVDFHEKAVRDIQKKAITETKSLAI